MPNKNKSTPKLDNLDALFVDNDGVNPIEKAEPQQFHKQSITHTAIKRLVPFKRYPFRLYEGERLDDMVASIKKNGVIVPIIVRRLGDVLEILSGHNRVNASEIAGLDKVPTLILDNVSDEDAMAYVVETNLIQRSFSDMRHSEKAAVLALHHSKMFSQDKRNDILEQLKLLENPHGYKDSGTCSQVANKRKTIAKVGQEYSLSKDTVARYLRVNQLVSELKLLLDNGNIAFVTAVTLSYLKESEQAILAECMEQHSLSVDIKKADMLRKYSEKGKLNSKSVHKILSGAIAHKPNRTPTVKVSKAVYAKYFKPTQSAIEIQEIVEKALEMYFEQL